MKAINICFIVLIFIFAVSAQSSTKSEVRQIATINIDALYDKTTGISELVKAIEPLNVEFKTDAEKLTVLFNKYKTLTDRMCPCSILVEDRLYACNRRGIPKEIEEARQLEGQLKDRKAEVKKRYLKRRLEVSASVFEKITPSIKEFAKVKGYATVLDISQLDLGVIQIVGFPYRDVTEEFVAYYRQKSALIPK